MSEGSVEPVVEVRVEGKPGAQFCSSMAGRRPLYPLQTVAGTVFQPAALLRICDRLPAVTNK